MDQSIENEKFQVIKLFGHEVLFTDIRVSSKLIPNGLYKYEVRHDDESWGEMVQLAKGIMVNHFGTVLSDKPIKLDENGYRDINEERDVKETNKPSMTINQYLQKTKNKHLEIKNITFLNNFWGFLILLTNKYIGGQKMKYINCFDEVFERLLSTGLNEEEVAYLLARYIDETRADLEEIEKHLPSFDSNTKHVIKH